MAADRRIPRGGLSATLDTSLAAKYLRPGIGNEILTIEVATENYELKLIVMCYSDEWMVRQKQDTNADTAHAGKSRRRNRTKRSNRALPCSQFLIISSLISVELVITQSPFPLIASSATTELAVNDLVHYGKLSPLLSIVQFLFRAEKRGWLMFPAKTNVSR